MPTLSPWGLGLPDLEGADRNSRHPLGPEGAGISRTGGSWVAVGVPSALGSRLLCRGVRPAPPPAGLVPDCRGLVLPADGSAPSAVPPPGVPTGAGFRGHRLWQQNREEPQAEVGDKRREMTNYPSQHTKLGLGVEPWPGEAAHNYHSLGAPSSHPYGT